MTYDEALAYLDSLTNFEHMHDPQAMRDVKLERMQALCERLGQPQRLFRSVLVAGTNGKGSICAMIYTILRAANLRVGLYTSPHLHDVRERIRVSLQPSAGSGEVLDDSDAISQDEFAALIDRLRIVMQEWNGHAPGGLPTYFEALTAAALLHFAKSGVRLAVLEVGLGGRLDATNVVEPAVSAFGPVGLDHTDVLGEDLVTIAREKAGIIRPRRAVISASQQPAVSALLREVVQDAPLLEYGQQLSAEIIAHDPQGMQLAIQGMRGRYGDLRLPLVGRHQAENATVAVAAVEALADDGVPHSPVRSGLAAVRWPGRLEVVQEKPVVVLDGAHNPQAVQALKGTLEELWPGRTIHLLIGVSQDKPLQALGGTLGSFASSITCTRSRHPRACEPQRLAEQLTSTHRPITVIPDAVDAYTYLLNTVPSDDLIVVTGSLFLVGQLRAALQQAQARARTDP